jgi:hypothetical protein
MKEGDEAYCKIYVEEANDPGLRGAGCVNKVSQRKRDGIIGR